MIEAAHDIQIALALIAITLILFVFWVAYCFAEFEYWEMEEYIKAARRPCCIVKVRSTNPASEHGGLTREWRYIASRVHDEFNLTDNREEALVLHNMEDLYVVDFLSSLYDVQVDVESLV